MILLNDAEIASVSGGNGSTRGHTPDNVKLEKQLNETIDRSQTPDATYHCETRDSVTTCTLTTTDLHAMLPR